MVSYAWAGFGAAFGPVIILSLVWRRMTRNGALVGMIVGAAVVLIWNQYEWLSLYEVVPGFVWGTLSIILVSLLDQQPSVSMTTLFAQVQQEMRHAKH